MLVIHRRKRQQSVSSWAKGFTLVEMLVVMSIIVFLMSISYATYANFIATSKEKATAVTISKINKILQQRKEAFDRLSFKDAASRMVGTNIYSNLGLGLPDIPDLQTAEVIVRKQRFQLAFPQRFEERSLFNGINYSSYFKSLPSRPDNESAALLYLSIMEGETFGAPQVDDDAFSTSEVKTIPIEWNDPADITKKINVDLKYFVDAWDQPLRFYRSPTSLIKPAAAASTTAFLPQVPNRTFSKLLIPSFPNFDPSLPESKGPDGLSGSNGADPTGWPGSDDPEPLNRDPDDPTLRFAIYFSNLDLAHQLVFRKYSKLYFAESTFHVPLVVSSGPDRKLGLYEPNDATGMDPGPSPLPDAGNMNCLARPLDTNPLTGTADLLDNITNLNQRNKGN